MFTVEQRAAVKGGEAIRVEIDGTPCVVVREDVFDRTRQVPDDPAPRAHYAATLAAWDQDPDPGLAAYQKYRKKS